MTTQEVAQIAELLCTIREELTEREQGKPYTSAVWFAGMIADMRRVFRASCPDFDDHTFTAIVYGTEE